MELKIRLATKEDELHIIRAIQNKHMDYNQPFHVKEDIANDRLVVAECDGKIVASMAFVFDLERNYVALKRLCIYRKENRRKGIATALIQEAKWRLGWMDIGLTPWITNPEMCALLEKLGFKYQYTFDTYYKFYLWKHNG